MSTPLPHRPWWRDDVTLVWRTDTSILVGDGERRVVVDEVTRELVAWLLSLHGQGTLDEAIDAAEAQGLGRHHPRRLLRAVRDTGGLDDASVGSATWRDTDAGRRDLLGQEVAGLRHSMGSPRLAADTMATRLRATVSVSGSGPVSEAVALVLTTAGIGDIAPTERLRSTSRKGRRHARTVSCHVLCDSSHAEAAIDTESLPLDVPHLPVSVHGAAASIGPLVLPGQTACLRCRDLHRADADRHWSRIAVQLERGPRTVTPAVLVQAAASWAAMQVLSLIDLGPRAYTNGGIEWTLALPHGRWVTTEHAPHPLCGCRWWAA